MSDPETTPSIDLIGVGDLVDRLAKIARTNGISSLSVAHGPLTIDLSIATLEAPPATVPARMSEIYPSVPVPASMVSTDVISAPMVGTFYAASGPGEPTFVEPGDRVEVGQTIGIIEAMKIMNEIPSEVAGTITEVLVSNGQAVEYGTPLFRFTPDAEPSA